MKWKLTFTSAGRGKHKAHRKAGAHRSEASAHRSKASAHSKISGSFGKGSRNVSPGRVEIKVKASAKAVKALRSRKLLHIKGEVSLRPTGGGGLEAVGFKALAHQPKRAKGKHENKHKRGK